MEYKIIDLLNKIANGEEVPNKIKWEGQEWKYNPINDYEGIKYGGCLLNQLTLDKLNEEVEILKEEKKIPEKLDTLTYTNRNTISIWNEHRDKINEIIDCLEHLKSKGDE